MPHPDYPKPHLQLELLGGPEVALAAQAHAGLLAFAHLLDLGPQLHTVLLQLAHLLQAGDQVVIQDLYGHLLMAAQVPMLPEMLQVPGKGRVVWQPWGRQRLGWPGGVVPTQTLWACARGAERHREAALASAPS